LGFYRYNNFWSLLTAHSNYVIYKNINKFITFKIIIKQRNLTKYLYLLFLYTTRSLLSQTYQKKYDLFNAVYKDRIKADVKILREFGARDTFSDTLSNTPGIGAVRRCIKTKFNTISKDYNNCINIFYQEDLMTTEMSNRVPHDALVVNVVEFQKGIKYPNRFIIKSCDLDSRNS
jgi:hypothetical protein